MPRPLKRGILGASTIILSKDIDKYALKCGSNFYETDVTTKILNSCCFYIKCKRNQACPICKYIVQVCHTLFYDSVKFISDVKSSDRIISKFIISQRMQIEGLLLYGFVATAKDTA